MPRKQTEPSEVELLHSAVDHAVHVVVGIGRAIRTNGMPRELEGYVDDATSHAQALVDDLVELAGGE